MTHNERMAYTPGSEGPRIPLLDHGYIQFIEDYGADERVIEAARMSTAKGFQGWGGAPCPQCEKAGRLSPHDHLFKTYEDSESARCMPCVCKGSGKTIGDEHLLRYLYENKHATPFEFAGLIIEVKAPLIVFREWQRHRTQSYNEMSARYVALPDENYTPTTHRIEDGVAKARATKNKQARGTSDREPTSEEVKQWLESLTAAYEHCEFTYQFGLRVGIPKELARLSVPVARYSCMRANANLRNWLAFLTLRYAPAAQYEIRVYAEALHGILSERFPRTLKLWDEETQRMRIAA